MGDKLEGEDSLRTKIQNGDIEAMLVVIAGVEKWMQTHLPPIIEKCHSHLLTWDGWRGLANDPRQFNLELNKWLKGARVAMQLLYRVPDHRPVAEDNKPERMARLVKDHPKDSWGQLSAKYKREHKEPITSKAAERAYKRFVERIQKAVLHQDKLAQSFQGQSILSESELTEKLPTLQSVLDILTKNE